MPPSRETLMKAREIGVRYTRATLSEIALHADLPTEHKALTVIDKFYYTALMWKRNELLQADLITLNGEINHVNEQIHNQIREAMASGYSYLSNPNIGSATVSSYSIANLLPPPKTFYYSNASSHALIATTKITGVSTEMDEDEPAVTPSSPPDITMMGVEEAEVLRQAFEKERKIVRFLEQLLDITSVATPGASAKRYNQYFALPRRVSEQSPSLGYVIKLSNYLVIYTNFVGHNGWALGADSNDMGHLPSNLSLLVVRCVRHIITCHSTKALQLAIKAKIEAFDNIQPRHRMVYGHSPDTLRAAHLIAEVGPMKHRLHAQTLFREYLSGLADGGWEVFGSGHTTLRTWGDVKHGLKEIIEELTMLASDPSKAAGVRGKIGNMFARFAASLFYQAKDSPSSLAIKMRKVMPLVFATFDLLDPAFAPKDPGRKPGVAFVDYFPLSAWCLVLTIALTIARELDILIDKVPASQDDHIPTDEEFKEVTTSEETVDVELYYHWFTSFLIAHQKEDPEIIREAMRSTALVHTMAKKEIKKHVDFWDSNA